MTRQTTFISATTAATAAATTGVEKTSPENTAQAPEAVNVESDFVVILAALLCALICVVGLIAVARCAWLRRSTSVTGNRSPSQALANKGLKKKFLQSLPKFTYSYEHHRGSGNGGVVDSEITVEECAICLTEFVIGDEIRMLPQCGHRFHVGCIDTWLGSHSSCPSCRMILGVVGRCTKCGEIPATAPAPATAITASSSSSYNNEVRVVLVESSEVDRKASEDNSSTFLP